MRGVFACKQLLFAFNAPTIATELAIIAYDAMAWESGKRSWRIYIHSSLFVFPAHLLEVEGEHAVLFA